MRVLRAKAVRKTLKFYKIVFGIVPTYHILLDGNFIFTAFKYKLDISHRLESLLQETSLKFYVLQSAVDELRAVGDKASAALEWALRCCEVVNDAMHKDLQPVQKIVRVVEGSAAAEGKQKKRFFVASQDKDVRSATAQIPGVPTLYFNKVTLVLEPPSSASCNYRNTAEDIKASIGEEETLLLDKVSTKTRDRVRSTVDNKVKELTQVMRPKKRASAPNPLSQVKASDSSQNSKKKKLGKYRQRS